MISSVTSAMEYKATENQLLSSVAVLHVSTIIASSAGPLFTLFQAGSLIVQCSKRLEIVTKFRRSLFAHCLSPSYFLWVKLFL